MATITKQNQPGGLPELRRRLEPTRRHRIRLPLRKQLLGRPDALLVVPGGPRRLLSLQLQHQKIIHVQRGRPARVGRPRPERIRPPAERAAAATTTAAAAVAAITAAMMRAHVNRSARFERGDDVLGVERLGLDGGFFEGEDLFAALHDAEGVLAGHEARFRDQVEVRKEAGRDVQEVNALSLTLLLPLLHAWGTQTVKGGFFLYMRYSTLLHLPPLRFQYDSRTL
jgi:hypothetical protein